MAYGFQIRNASNVLVVDTGTKISNVINYGTYTPSITTSASNFISPYYWGESTNLSAPGMTTSNASEVGVTLHSNAFAIATFPPYLEVTRDTNQFRIRYYNVSASASFTPDIKWMVLRY